LLLLDSPTTAVVPEATWPLRNAVQFVLPGVGSDAGVQDTDVSARGWEPVTVIVPVFPFMGIAEAASEAPRGLETVMGMVLAPAATVTATLATTPFWSRLEFIPSTRQV